MRACFQQHLGYISQGAVIIKHISQLIAHIEYIVYSPSNPLVSHDVITAITRRNQCQLHKKEVVTKNTTHAKNKGAVMAPSLLSENKSWNFEYVKHGGSRRAPVSPAYIHDLCAHYLCKV